MVNEYRVMQKWGASVGRKGMSDAVANAVKDSDRLGPKGLMELAGRLKAIAQAAGCDDYWREQVSRGYDRQLYEARRQLMEHEPI